MIGRVSDGRPGQGAGARRSTPSEFRYRNPIIEDGTVVVAVSQSGETADTLAARCTRRGSAVRLSLGVVNVVGLVDRGETDAGVYLRVGPEIGVASTKAFTGQVAVLTLITLFMARRRIMSADQCARFAQGDGVGARQDRTHPRAGARIRKITEKYVERENWLFLGRGYNYPTALEGALKLKEISYIHAEGMPAAEMEHGRSPSSTRACPPSSSPTRGGSTRRC